MTPTPLRRSARVLWNEGHDRQPAYADFLLFLSSSTSVNSASTTSSLAASFLASASACCLYMASPSFIEACATVLDDVVDAEFTEVDRSEEHTSELQSLRHLVCRL